LSSGGKNFAPLERAKMAGNCSVLLVSSYSEVRTTETFLEGELSVNFFDFHKKKDFKSFTILNSAVLLGLTKCLNAF
jgi:hypothetical protein